MSLREIEARNGMPGKIGLNHADAATLLRWVRALLEYVEHNLSCPTHPLAGYQLGMDVPSCTCGLDALREEIGG